MFVRLPTNYELIDTRAVTELDTHRAGIDGAAARNAIRSLVAKAVIQPGDARGRRLRAMQLKGDLFGTLEVRASALDWPRIGHKKPLENPGGRCVSRWLREQDLAAAERALDFEAARSSCLAGSRVRVAC